jgi:hypothetical protein
MQLSVTFSLPSSQFLTIVFVKQKESSVSAFLNHGHRLTMMVTHCRASFSVSVSRSEGVVFGDTQVLSLQTVRDMTLACIFVRTHTDYLCLGQLGSASERAHTHGHTHTSKLGEEDRTHCCPDHSPEACSGSFSLFLLLPVSRNCFCIRLCS